MTGIGYGIVRLGSVVCSSWQSFLQERPYATAYWPFSVRESCTSNANPLSSENLKTGFQTASLGEVAVYGSSEEAVKEFAALS